ncbi:hypothetical protein GCM10028808_26320 [Spirosoma migulaei]
MLALRFNYFFIGTVGTSADIECTKEYDAGIGFIRTFENEFNQIYEISKARFHL